METVTHIQTATGISDIVKSGQLMSTLQTQLEASLTPDQYLIDICHVLINQQHQTLTDIATNILHQLNNDITTHLHTISSQAVCEIPQVQDIRFRTQEEELETSNSLNKLENNFTSLMIKVNTGFMTLETPDLLNRIIMWLKTKLSDYTSIISKLNDATAIANIFDIIQPVYDCIDTELLEDMCEEFIPAEQDIILQLKAHQNKANELYSSKTVKQLKNDLESIYRPYLSSNLANMPKIIIKLQEKWAEMKMKGLKRLIGKMLPLDSKQSILHYIDIIPGSITINYYVCDITADCLIEHGKGKTHIQFMRLIGIFSLHINDHAVLQEHENMNFTFELAFLEAVTAGHNEAVEFLLQLETVIIDHTNEEGKTALMLACERGHEDIVHSLLSAGANVNLQDNNGWTALMRASKHNHVSIINLMKANCKYYSVVIHSVHCIYNISHYHSTCMR